MASSSIEERMARLEGAYEQINLRLGRLEDRLEGLRRDVRGQFYWLLGLLLPMWVTIILSIVLRG